MRMQCVSLKIGEHKKLFHENIEFQKKKQKKTQK